MKKIILSLMLTSTFYALINTAALDPQTEFFEACKTGNAEHVQNLLARIDINATKNDGNTGLMIAVEHGQDNIVKLLLPLESINVTKRNLSRKTCFDIAYTREYYKMCSDILYHSPWCHDYEKYALKSSLYEYLLTSTAPTESSQALKIREIKTLYRRICIMDHLQAKLGNDWQKFEADRACIQKYTLLLQEKLCMLLIPNDLKASTNAPVLLRDLKESINASVLPHDVLQYEILSFMVPIELVSIPLMLSVFQASYIEQVLRYGLGLNHEQVKYLMEKYVPEMLEAAERANIEILEAAARVGIGRYAS